jgi:hypothetical protein
MKLSQHNEHHRRIARLDFTQQTADGRRGHAISGRHVFASLRE